MTRYWINFKGNQSGPHSVEELEKMGVDKTAYVWHSGLPDWVKITKVPELNQMLERMAAGASYAPDSGEEPAPQAVTNETPEHTAEVVPELPPLCRQPGYAMGAAPQQPGYAPQYASGAAGYHGAQATAEATPCPPTNLVWAIISTVCCCWPLGVLGIIFACLTKKKYKEGDYLKAEKYSEYGAWAIIASIMLGLVSMPLACSHYIIQGLG